MKTNYLNNSRQLMGVLFCLFMLFSELIHSQSNCIVNPINGPTIINGSGSITKLYYVTSNGAHLWTFPAGVTATYGANGNDSAFVTFPSSYTTGTISVRRNGPSCANIKQYLTVTRASCNLSVNAGSDQTVYFGYAPLACANLNATITNGTGPYAITWSSNQTGASINVCPSVSTSYSVTVQDAGGCIAKDVVEVCVVNVVCYAGKSNNTKVEVCHKGRDICISPNAVPAHLAHGCTLGDCSEANSCGQSSTSTARFDNSIPNKVAVTSFPNPAKNSLNLTFENGLEDGNFEYYIYTLNGELVEKGIISEYEQSLDISNYKEGLYYIKFSKETEKPLLFIKQ